MISVENPTMGAPCKIGGAGHAVKPRRLTGGLMRWRTGSDSWHSGAMAPARAAPAGAGHRHRIFLIDGSGYIFRAYHALPPLSRSDGTATGAVLGFCNMLSKLLDDVAAEGGGHVAVIFDKGHLTFRNEIYADYKANREAPPEDLVPQFGLIREATRAFNVPCIEQEGFEADDIIATYARIAAAEGFEVVIVSSDKDLMQLVREGVGMFDPIKSRAIGVAEVRARFGVDPDRVVDVQALAGDATDNVPGVRGIGVKTAATLINDYGDLDTVLARAGEIKQPKRRQLLIESADDARLSRELVRLREDVPVDGDIEALAATPPDPEVLLSFLGAMEFTKLAERLRPRFEAAVGPPVAAAARLTETPTYQLVATIEDLAAFVALARASGTVAIAVQADSPRPMRARLVGIALSPAAGRAVYVPLVRHGAADLVEVAEAAGALAPETALPLLKSLLEDPAVLKIGHDIKNDMHLLARHGIVLRPIDDTMLLSFVLGAGADGHTLEAVTRRELDAPRMVYKEIAGSGRKQLRFDQVPLDGAIAYAGEEADLIGRARAVLKPRLVAEHLVNVHESLERPLIAVLCRMERNGIRVDPAILAELSDDFGRRVGEFETAIHALAGHPFNIGSPKQLGEVLFDEMGLAGGRKTKTGAYGTGADILEGLAAEGHELPARVLDWRQLTKLKNTYTDTLQAEINPETGRVHTTYAMAGAATGRLASNDPNLQNIPVRTEEGRKIRRAFVAEPGRLLLSADYSQIELRLLAHMAAIEPLREVFANGADIHAMTASQVFGVPIEGMDPAVRRGAKAINFGIIYGISAFGLARQLGIERGEAQRYIEAYFERYPGIRDYMERTREFCRRHGYVETIFGRRCHLPGIHDKNHAKRSFAERAAINAPLQGSAADIIKRAMIQMAPALEASGLDAAMLLSVHDELIFEVADDQVDELAALAARIMGGVAHLSVPLTVDTGAGPNWDEAH